MRKIATYLLITSYLLVAGFTGEAQNIFAAKEQGSPIQQPQSEDEIQGFKLYGNSPNPVKEKTYFKFEVEKSMNVQVKLFDLLGNEKRRSQQDAYQPGTHEIEMDVSGLESGIYFYKFYIGNKTITKRLNIVSSR